jgi:hypothetical protein
MGAITVGQNSKNIRIVGNNFSNIGQPGHTLDHIIYLSAAHDTGVGPDGIYIGYNTMNVSNNIGALLHIYDTTAPRAKNITFEYNTALNASSFWGIIFASRGGDANTNIKIRNNNIRGNFTNGVVKFLYGDAETNTTTLLENNVFVNTNANQYVFQVDNNSNITSNNNIYWNSGKGNGTGIYSKDWKPTGSGDRIIDPSTVTNTNTTTNTSNTTNTNTSSNTSTNNSNTSSASGVPSAPQPGSLTGLTNSGPITLQSNQTYNALKITNPNGPCMTGSNVSNVTISNSEIGPCGGDAIKVVGGSGIKVLHNYIHNTTNWNSNGEASSDSGGVRTDNTTDVLVQSNYIMHVAYGIYSTGGSKIVFDRNFVTGLHGDSSRAIIDHIGGQMAQYFRVAGNGSRVTCNVSDVVPGRDWNEDHVNMCESYGSANDPIKIMYNKVRGTGTSRSNGGLLAGDCGGKYIEIVNNNVITPGGYGVAIGGGMYNKLESNKVYMNRPEYSRGYYVINFGGGSSGTACSNNSVINNRINFIGDSSRGVSGVIAGPTTFTQPGYSGYWCANTTYTGNNENDTSLNPTDLWNEEFPQCK